MSVTHKLQRISVDDYLSGEQLSDARHEYIDGQVYAMVGSSDRHNLIAGSLHSSLRLHLRGSSFKAFMSDMKVRIQDDFYYPDVVVSCENRATPVHHLIEPTLILEVISPSTEARDRFEKRIAYQRLESLEEYVLVAQDKMEVEIYRRENDGWEIERYHDNETIQFRSVDLEIPILQIYEDVLR